MQMNLFWGPLWFLLLGSQTLCWCCKANWGNILQYNKFSFACFLWLINYRVWLLKNYSKEILFYPFLSTQSHCVILGLHQIFNNVVTFWRTLLVCVELEDCNGTCAFPRLYTWLLQCCTDKMLLTKCSLQETGVLEHVSFIASLLSLSAHMGGSLLRT